MANPFSCFSEKGKMADRMCDGLLSPTFIALSNLEKLLELRFKYHAY